MSDPSSQSQLPSDVGAERRALSAIMRRGISGLYEAAERLRPEMFTGRRERVAEEALGLVEDGNRPDQATLAGRLPEGFAAECEEAAAISCSPANLATYVDSVRAAHLRRRMATLGREAREEALELQPGSLDAAETAQEDFERKVLGLSGEALAGGGARPASDVTEEAIGRLRRADEETLTGVTTGFREIDRITRGWQPGWLNVVAARTSMGKSALMGQCAAAAALGEAGVRYNGSFEVEPVPVAIFSLEMPAEEIMARMICERAKVNARGQGRTDAEWDRINRAASQLHQAPIYIDDEPGLTPREVCARLRRLHREKGVGAAWLDYLQIVGSPRSASFDREVLRIGHATRAFRDTAKSLEIPFCALAQINRSVEKGGGDARPSLATIRESGEIEEASNLVAFLYRDAYYGVTRDADGEPTQFQREEEGESVQADVAEFIVGKQRGGATGTRKLAFVQEQAAFRDLASRPSPRPSQPSAKKTPF